MCFLYFVHWKRISDFKKKTFFKLSKYLIKKKITKFNLKKYLALISKVGTQ